MADGTQDHYLDALAIATSAVANYDGSTAAYLADVLRLLEGKSEVEVASTVVGLGQLNAVLVVALADSQGREPDEVLREFALAINAGVTGEE